MEVLTQRIPGEIKNKNFVHFVKTFEFFWHSHPFGSCKKAIKHKELQEKQRYADLPADRQV